MKISLNKQEKKRFQRLYKLLIDNNPFDANNSYDFCKEITFMNENGKIQISGDIITLGRIENLGKIINITYEKLIFDDEFISLNMDNLKILCEIYNINSDEVTQDIKYYSLNWSVDETQTLKFRLSKLRSLRFRTKRTNEQQHERVIYGETEMSQSLKRIKESRSFEESSMISVENKINESTIRLPLIDEVDERGLSVYESQAPQIDFFNDKFFNDFLKKAEIDTEKDENNKNVTQFKESRKDYVLTSATLNPVSSSYFITKFKQKEVFNEIIFPQKLSFNRKLLLKRNDDYQSDYLVRYLYSNTALYLIDIIEKTIKNIQIQNNDINMKSLRNFNNNNNFMNEDNINNNTVNFETLGIDEFTLIIDSYIKSLKLDLIKINKDLFVNDSSKKNILIQRIQNEINIFSLFKVLFLNVFDKELSSTIIKNNDPKIRLLRRKHLIEWLIDQLKEDFVKDNKRLKESNQIDQIYQYIFNSLVNGQIKEAYKSAARINNVHLMNIITQIPCVREDKLIQKEIEGYYGNNMTKSVKNIYNLLIKESKVDHNHLNWKQLLLIEILFKQNAEEDLSTTFSYFQTNNRIETSANIQSTLNLEYYLIKFFCLLNSSSLETLSNIYYVHFDNNSDHHISFFIFSILFNIFPELYEENHLRDIFKNIIYNLLNKNIEELISLDIQQKAVHLIKYSQLNPNIERFLIRNLTEKYPLKFINLSPNDLPKDFYSLSLHYFSQFDYNTAQEYAEYSNNYEWALNIFIYNILPHYIINKDINNEIIDKFMLYGKECQDVSLWKSFGVTLYDYCYIIHNSDSNQDYLKSLELAQIEILIRKAEFLFEKSNIPNLILTRNTIFEELRKIEAVLIKNKEKIDEAVCKLILPKVDWIYSENIINSVRKQEFNLSLNAIINTKEKLLKIN